MTNRREYLRQQRMRRRRIFSLCCLIFLVTVIVLIVVLVNRIRANNSSAAVSDQVTSSSEEESLEVVSPEADDPAIETSTTQWMEKLTSDVEMVARENSIPVVATPAGYELRFMTEEDIHKGNQILINKQYAYEFLDFSDASELVSMYNIMSGSYDVSSTNVLMQSVAAEPLNLMLSDFYKEKGYSDLLILCGYRTMEESQQLYDASAAANGTDHADRYVMKPGYSEHHSALATDIGIYGSDGSITYTFYEGDYAWITENCYKYGFIVRYPEEKAAITEIDYESWHFRYLGVPNATAVVNEGLCLEEYIEFIKDYSADGPHYQVTTADGSYEIYYTEGLQVPVPTTREYEISGNNVDGFIVTMKIS